MEQILRELLHDPYFGKAENQQFESIILVHVENNTKLFCQSAGNKEKEEKEKNTYCRFSGEIELHVQDRVILDSFKHNKFKTHANEGTLFL